MTMNKDRLFLSIGMICLVIALALNRFAPHTSVFDFSEGFFIGLSLVLNMAFLVRYWTKKKRSQES